MKMAVIADEPAQTGLAAPAIPGKLSVEWIPAPIPVNGASVYFDLLFIPSPERINRLKDLQPALIVVNAVTTTLEELPEGFIRVNGWPGFLNRPVMEAAGRKDPEKMLAAEVFALLGKSTEWVPDIPGFITARVISMIINEAYFALEENVSSREDIDTAMKLGTNYPYGPFEWSKRIGLEKIYALLEKLAEKNPRYQPSSLLVREALAS